jgi:hypothetical protein
MVLTEDQLNETVMTILVSVKAAIVWCGERRLHSNIWVDSGEIRGRPYGRPSGKRLLRMMMLFHRKVPQQVVMPSESSLHIQV